MVGMSAGFIFAFLRICIIIRVSIYDIKKMGGVFR